MRQLVVLFQLILLTAALAAGPSIAEPLALQKHSVSLVALSETVTLRSDFEGEFEADEPTDLFSSLSPAGNANSQAYQLRATRAQSPTASQPPARGPPLYL